jgi:hypothetical protein
MGCTNTDSNFSQFAFFVTKSAHYELSFQFLNNLWSINILQKTEHAVLVLHFNKLESKNMSTTTNL